MKNRRRIEGGDFPLPEVLIQRIQSFMDGKQAAQTSILSKTWHKAWSTRPNLILDQEDFGVYEWSNQGDEKRFWDFAKKTIQRYEALNLKIESFTLCMLNLKPRYFDLVKNYIAIAMRMGALDFDLELIDCNPTFPLPSEVLASDTLVTLSVSGCKIDSRKVSCPKLKSLSLDRIWVEDDDIISNLCSRCPLIEELSLGSYSKGLYHPDRVYCFGSVLDGLRGNVYQLYKLKSLFLSNVNVDTMFFSNLSSFPCLTDLSLEDCLEDSLLPTRVFESDALVRLSISRCNFDLRKIRCRKLKSLFLGNVDTMFFSNLSASFPCLKDLSLDHCRGRGPRISSPSLECISFIQVKALRVMLDVPSIRKLKVSSSNAPPLLFETSSREWESDISLDCHSLSAAWLNRLKQLLKTLSLSKISLSVCIEDISKTCIEDISETVVHFRGLPKPAAVENLRIETPPSFCSSVLEALFWSCRPKFLTLHLDNSESEWNVNNNFLDILRKRNVEGAREYFLMMNHELEKVNVQLFEEEDCGETIHFRLKWRDGRG